jgi:hypothetical protein
MARFQKAGTAPTHEREQSREPPPKRKERPWLSVHNEELWTRVW